MVFLLVPADPRRWPLSRHHDQAGPGEVNFNLLRQIVADGAAYHAVISVGRVCCATLRASCEYSVMVAVASRLSPTLARAACATCGRCGRACIRRASAARNDRYAGPGPPTGGLLVNVVTGGILSRPRATASFRGHDEPLMP